MSLLFQVRHFLFIYNEPIALFCYFLKKAENNDILSFLFIYFYLFILKLKIHGPGSRAGGREKKTIKNNIINNLASLVIKSPSVII